ncbi:MAG: creatininase family protein [Rhizobiaceae bacterium]|nr:creatininase family protein [Rhizobiaceae bacterium]
MISPPPVQLEVMRPRQIREAIERSSLVYLPLGTIEWHGEHLPVGLDGLTAHHLCIAAVASSGGLVYPPLYYGTGGGHGEFPWTVMLEDGAELEAILQKTLNRLQDMGIHRAVIFSGHFAKEQLALIDGIAERWNAANKAMSVIATSVSRAEGLSLAPDHAGVFETTLLDGMRPSLVSLKALPAYDEEDETFAWNDPDSPVWGVYGPDPRLSDLSQSKELARRLASWLATIATEPVHAS